MRWHMKHFVGSNGNYGLEKDLDAEMKLLHDLFADKHNETVDIKISE